MTWYTCAVTEAGPGGAGLGETSIPVIYICLTDIAGKFTNQFFYADDASKRETLAVALAAINGKKHVQVDADPPNPGGTPITCVSRMYLLTT